MKGSLKKALRVLGKILKWTLFVLIGIFLLLFIIWKVPAVHDYAVKKGTAFFNSKTGGNLSIGEVDLRLPFYIGLENIRLLTPEGEKLASVGNLDVYPGWRMLLTKTIRVDEISIGDVEAKIYADRAGRWNFDFIAEGFSDTSSTPPPEPDTTSSGWEFSVGDLNLRNFSFVYADRATTDSVDVSLGILRLDMEEVDPEGNSYLVESLELLDNDVFLKFSITGEEVEEEDDDSGSSIPDLGLDFLRIEETKVTLILGEELPYTFRVGRLSTVPKEIDLPANRYHIEELALSDTDLDIPLTTSPDETSPSDTLSDPSGMFPPIDVKLKSLNIDNLGIAAFNEERTLHEVVGLMIEASDLSADRSGYTIDLKSLRGRYNEFDALTDFAGNFGLTPQEAWARGVYLGYGASELNLDASISYTAFGRLLSELNFNRASVSLDQTILAHSDMSNIAETLEFDSIPLPRDDIRVDLLAGGNFSDLRVEKLTVRTGRSRVGLSAASKGKEIWPRDVILNTFDVFLDRNDLLPFLEPAGVDTSNLPARLELGIEGHYLAGEADVEGSILTEFGKIEIRALGDGWRADVQNMKLSLNSDKIAIGEYLRMEPEFFADLEFEATTPNLKDSLPTICSYLSIDTLHYDGYGYSNLRLDADLMEQDLLYAFAVRDSFVNSALGGQISPGDTLSMTIEGKVYGLDMQGTGLTEKDIRGGLDFYAHFKQDSLSRDLFAKIDEILFVKEGERYPIKPITASYYASPDSTSAGLNSGFVEFSSVSNRSLDSIQTSIAELFAKGERRVLTDTSAYWKANFVANDLQDIKDLFLPQLRRFEPSSAEVDFSAGDNEFIVQALFPGIEYGSISIDSLSVLTETGGTDVIRNLHIDRFAYDTLEVRQFNIDLNRGTAGADFRLSMNPDTTDHYYLITAQLAADTGIGGYRVSFNDTLILAGEPWNYHEKCAITLDDKGAGLEFFEFSRNDGNFSLERREDEGPLVMRAQRFPVYTIGGIPLTKTKLLTGTLDGELSLNPDGTFEGKGSISDLVLAEAKFGKLTWDASKENGRFKTKIENRGEAADFDLGGTITPMSDSTSALDLNFKMTSFDLKALNEILSSQIDSANGSFTTDISIRGTNVKPSLSGNVAFANALIRPKGSRIAYTITDQSLKIEPDRLNLNGFTLEDENGRTLSFQGYVQHENFTDPRLDLSIKSDNFTLLDLDQSAGQSVYGKLVADLDVKISGKLNAPLVNTTIGINEPTDFSYFVTETVEREAFDETLLIWTDFEESNQEDAILTRNKGQTQTSGNIFANNPKIKGSLIIDKSAIFKVVIDSSAGDYLEIRGDGKLDIDYDRTGALRFNGIYEVADGFYQMSFYNLVKRKFNFKKGSRIVWNGEPTNANIDITAVYKTRAGIANLMLTDPSAAYDESFQQQLPFLVLMDIKGKLLDPEIYFDIQLDESAEGALSGSVEARLQDLTRDENRLNKQVFALLVLGSFIPQSGGSDANILANQARNSASQILTNQLNSLSDKYVKGVDINVDLYSYGGTAGEGNTDLNINVAKSFANNRMTVKVGSTIALEEQNPNAAQASQQQILTNVELEYKLTPDGRYRLIVFSKTDLEDIVIGRITRSGGGFVFQRDFDRFKHLFDPPTEEELIEEDEEEIMEEDENDDDEQGSSE